MMTACAAVQCGAAYAVLSLLWALG